MLNFLSSRQINDVVFGKLEYRRYIFHENFWNGKVKFTSISNKIDVYIVSDKYGVLESQRNFFRDLEKKYQESPILFLKGLENTFRTFHGEETTKEFINYETIGEDFELERLFIPNFDISEDEWELSYNFKMWNQSYTLHFDEWKFLYGTFDD